MDVKRAVILGNHQAGKTTIVSAFAGITREAALHSDGRQDYLYGAKEIRSGNTSEMIVLQGTPRPWGRMSIFRASAKTMEDASAFIIALRMDDTLAVVQRFFTRIEGRQNKTPAPVLVLVRKEDDGRVLPAEVTALVKEKGAVVVEFLRDELANRTESAVRSLYEAVSVLLSAPALAIAPVPPVPTPTDENTQKPLAASRPMRPRGAMRASRPKPAPYEQKVPAVVVPQTVAVPEVEDKKKDDERRERLRDLVASVRAVPLALGS